MKDFESWWKQRTGSKDPYACAYAAWNAGYQAAKEVAPTQEPSKYSDIVSDGGFDPRNKFDAAAEIAYWQGRSESWERDAKVLQEQIAKLQDDIEFMRTCVEEACKDRKYFEEQASEKNRWQNKAENAAAQIAELQRIKTDLEGYQVKTIDEYEARLAEQRQTIAALNDIIGGEGSLTTDNIVHVSRLEEQIAKLEAAALKPMSDERLREIFNAACTAEPLSEGWPELVKFARAILDEVGVPKP